MDSLTLMLQRHEGTGPVRDGRLFPYLDTVGKWTLGWGRNITDRGISGDEALFLLQNDIEQVKRELDQALPWWTKLDDVRRDVLIDMGFNLGVLTPPLTAKLLTFKTSLGLIEKGWYEEAADRLKQTKWAQQVGSRADELIEMLRTGRYATG
jgi:lysozyme